MITIIIPIYNEEEILRNGSAYFNRLAQLTEVIFVDGGSIDGSVSLIPKEAAVIHSAKGRARQMNEGSRRATGQTLLFLHADCRLDLDNWKKIAEETQNPQHVGGCFTQKYTSPKMLYRWIAWTGNIRARVSSVFYGDQGIFVRRDVFDQLGGFPEIDLCEDVYFTKKLRTCGRTTVLKHHITCSARRWSKQGVAATFFLNMRINIALILNRDILPLAKLYKDIR